MNRSRHFLQGLSASWLATFVTVLYSLISIPVALRYLSVAEFGLLMLVQQVAGYLTLIELGMTSATARILVDYKDDKSGTVYGSVITTGSIIFLVQGLLILLVGIIASPLAISLLSVPTELEAVALHLLRWLSCAFAIGTSLRIFSSILYANRRIDLLNLLMSLVPILGLLIMWVVLTNGGGLWLMPLAFVLPALIAGVCAGIATIKLGFMPKKGIGSPPDWAHFRSMLHLGKDMFLVTAGNQVLEASQLMIVTRTMGLGAAAVWSVSTKLFTLVYQLVTKVEGTAVIFFSEMMVRGERSRLALRFRHVYELTAGLAAVSLAVVTAINRPFVTVWASADLAWWPWLGLMLAVLVYLNCITRCHVDLIMHTKDIRGLKYVFFLEAIGFVSLALYATRYLGFYGILGSAVLCAIVFRGIYTVRRTASYFNISAATVAWGWLRPSLLASVLLLPFVLFAPLIASLTNNPWCVLAFVSAWIFVPALAVLGTVAFPYNLRREVIDRITARFRAGG